MIFFFLCWHWCYPCTVLVFLIQKPQKLISTRLMGWWSILQILWLTHFDFCHFKINTVNINHWCTFTSWLNKRIHFYFLSLCNQKFFKVRLYPASSLHNWPSHESDFASFSIPDPNLSGVSKCIPSHFFCTRSQM